MHEIRNNFRVLLKSHLISNIFEAGCDEAGRGCLVGPVYAAAVILPRNYRNRFINDSKKLTPEVRDQLGLKLSTRLWHGL